MRLIWTRNLQGWRNATTLNAGRRQGYAVLLKGDLDLGGYQFVGQRPVQAHLTMNRAVRRKMMKQSSQPPSVDCSPTETGVGEVKAVEALEIGLDGVPVFVEELDEADDSPRFAP